MSLDAQIISHIIKEPMALGELQRAGVTAEWFNGDYGNRLRFTTWPESKSITSVRSARSRSEQRQRGGSAGTHAARLLDSEPVEIGRAHV